MSSSNDNLDSGHDNPLSPGRATEQVVETVDVTFQDLSEKDQERIKDEVTKNLIETAPIESLVMTYMQSHAEDGELQQTVHRVARQVAALVGATLVFGLIAVYAIWYGVTSGVLPVAATGVLLLGVIFYHLMRLRA
ncbi:hypothetical protein [Halobacterium noricense]|uniref:hypothetical protein n=1 Tax=Halobacterium noricense TaxID=223182 RepID=UPI001E33789E|nr:hypothetical protein [Halobacterium noricense]UHH24886.1 hypothetical protein LT974_12975 [Halobacterium noricense]